MSQSARRLRVGLLLHTYGAPFEPGEETAAVRDLARALQARGHLPSVITSRRGTTQRATEHGVPVIRNARLPEAPLRARGFAGPLTHLPLAVWELLRGAYEVAHAFSPVDALAARRWRQATGRPVVFTSVEPLVRERLAHRRLQLPLVDRAVAQSDATLAATKDAQAALRRWLTVDAPLVEPSDAVAHERLYETLLDPS